MKNAIIGTVALLSACSIADADITAKMRYDGRTKEYCAPGEVTNPIPFSELQSMIPDGQEKPIIPFIFDLCATAGERLRSLSIWSVDAPTHYMVAPDESDPDPVDCVIDIKPDQESNKYLHWHSIPLNGSKDKVSGYVVVNPELVDFLDFPDIGLAIRVDYNVPDPDNPNTSLYHSAEFVFHAPVIKKEDPVLVEKPLELLAVEAAK